MRSPRTTARRRPLRGVIASVLATLLVVTGLSFAGPAAAAAGDIRFETTMPTTGTITGGTTYNASLLFKVPTYAGQTLTIEYPSEIANPDGLVAELTKLEAIEPDTVTVDRDARTVTFTVKTDSAMDQAAIDFDFVVSDPVTSMRDQTIEWSVGGEKTTSTVILLKKGDVPSPVSNNSARKSLGANDLWRSVGVDANRQVVVAARDNATMAYTIAIDAKDARTIALSDVIDTDLDIVTSSVSASLSTWTDGLNKSVAPVLIDSATDSLSGLISMPADSRLVITYKAKLDAAALEAIRVELQRQLDAADPEKAASLKWTFTNTASTGETGVPVLSANATLNYTVNAPAGPNLGAVFSKSSSISQKQLVEIDQDGALLAPIDVTYTLTANLTEFTGKPASTVPNRNIVITDNRANQNALTWVRGPGFILDGTGAALPEAPDGLTEDEFADAWSGHYRVNAAGALQINLGNTTPYVNHRFTVKAQATTTAGLAPLANAGGDKFAEQAWAIKNQAVMKYRTENAGRLTKETSFTVYTAKDVSGGVDEVNAFAKSTAKETQIGADGIAQVPFTFTTGWANKYDVTKSTIVDEVDHSVFNVSAANLAAVAATARGSFADVTFKPGDVDVVLTTEGNLELSLSDAFVAANPYIHVLGNLNLTIDLPTHKVEGRTTIDFVNAARLYGQDRTQFPWISTATASATSYSSELEVRKTLYAGGGSWNSNLRAKFDADGGLVDDTFIYRIQVRPHGSMNGKTILPVEDVLPEGLQWQGFVADADLDSKTYSTSPTFNMQGGITATWGQTAGGKPALILTGRINTSVALHVNFQVKVLQWTEDVSIVNSIGSAKATITPSAGYPLVIEKRDAVRPDTLITDENARFRVDRQLPDGAWEKVLDNAYLLNGNVVVAGTDGEAKAIVVPDEGVYRVSEMNAPAGYEPVTISTDGTTSNKSALITVADGASEAAVITNSPVVTPVVKSYAIGDVVWYDDAANGTQPSAGKRPVAGVTVALLDGTLNPVLGDDGSPVTTTTDANGAYLFDELPAGEYRVGFTLPAALADDYVFTTKNSGTGTADDSDAEPATGLTDLITLGDSNTELIRRADVTATQGIDPTWDAGIVRKPVPLTYAIGDRTWIDTNRDGVQGDREADIDGIIVRLLDENGVTLDETTTHNGRYLFDELPAGSYRVEFEIPAALRTTYAFTKSDVPADTNGITVGSNADSDAAATATSWIGSTGIITLDETNTELSTSYTDQVVAATAGIDATWDAGVIVKKVSLGDFVWIDENRNGLQDQGEPGIPGIVLELRGPSGDPVRDEFGAPRTTTTGPNGEYLFEQLPALANGETYTVRIDPTAPQNRTALEGLTPTKDDQPGATNSSTWEATSVPTLTTDGDHDPTLDFGFVHKTYAVGDYVWIDANADGKQDAAEAALEGVTVELLLDGTVIATDTTDANGRYLFDELIAGAYEVRFTLTPAQNALYFFTAARAGSATGASDSNAASETGLTGTFVLGDTNTDLTRAYADQPFTATQGVDPTWDAGVIVRTPAPTNPGGSGEPGQTPEGEQDPRPTAPELTPGTETPDAESTESPATIPGDDADADADAEADAPGDGATADAADGLPATGQNVPVAAALVALIALLAGFVLIARRRLARR